MLEVRENCGIAAVALSNIKGHPIGGASYYLYRMLLQQQNRGQLAAGIATFNPNRGELIKRYIGLGKVDKVFRTHHEAKNLAILQNYAGIKGIGHVRYATFGPDDINLTQPFERRHGRTNKWFVFAFNGNIANFEVIKKSLKKRGYHLINDSDTEAIMHLITIAQTGNKKKSLVEVFREVTRQLDGAYSLVFMNADGDIAAVRDPYGFKPLVFGKNNGLMAIASESAALTNLGIKNISNLEPGKMLLIRDGKISFHLIQKSKRKAHCMFEWVYFANVASKIDEVSVYKARWRLGRQLAKNETLKLDKDFIVVPVPDTSKPAADAFASVLRLPAKEGLLRNRYVGRTFIEARHRFEKVRDKYTLNTSVLKNKKVILIDDSIVRGTTSKTLIEYIKSANPKEVHLRVTCPPIFYPCFYGIDMSTLSELIAAQIKGKSKAKITGIKEYPKKIIEKIRKKLKVKSLRYNSIEDLLIALKKPEKELCIGCLTGVYPTPYGKILLKKAIKNFVKGKKNRTYES